jgi:cytochrome c peroxidase
VRRAALATVCAAAALAGAAAPRADEGARLPAPEPGSYALPPLGPAADGEVLASDGSSTTLHALYADRVVLLAFVYSACGDAEGCPLAMAVFHRIGRLLRDDAATRDRLRVLSLSFDPARDTPAAMARIAESVAADGLDWRFLTTSGESALAPILAAYGQNRVEERDERGEPTGRYAHALRVFLIDPSGRIRNEYGSSFLEADLVVADVRTLVAEGGAAGPAAAARADASDALLARTREPPLGLPPLPLPDGEAPSAERIALGRRLFFDRRLSENATVSCANCHVPRQGFTQREQRTSVGIEGRSVRRNAPTLYNAAHLRNLFHDGRETRLSEQPWQPLLARNEMGNESADAVLARLRSVPGYDALFAAAFPARGLTRESVGIAIASYERALVSGDSPFDRWRYGGDAGALGPSAQRGFALFSGRAGCTGCHLVGERTALFTDDAFHDTGIGAVAEADAERSAALRVTLAPGQSTLVAAQVARQVGEPRAPDLGRYEMTRDPADRWRYRTPSLRNVALTAPYMHDGSLATLAEVIGFYDRGGAPNPGLDPRIHPLHLSAQEAGDLVAFLESLTGSDVEALVADAESAPIGNVGSERAAAP